MKISRCIVPILLGLGTSTVHAEGVSDGALDISATVQIIAAIRDEVIASDRLAGEFESLAGSRQNAQNLVIGLRNAKSVKMAAQTTADADVSFTPPTRPLSFSDIHQALLLAQAHLQSKNIANPTPAQIRAALAGGELANAQGDRTRVTGILPLYLSGMSWAAIAKSLHLGKPKKVVAASYPFTVAT